MATRDDDDFPPDPLLDDSDPSGREARPGFVPEFVRRVAVAGLGAIFMTEEGLRSLAGQLKLPKEALGFILSQAEKTKDDVGRVVSEELRRFLQSEKLRDEFFKMLSGMTVEVKAQIRLVPSSPAESSSTPEEGAAQAAPAASAPAPEDGGSSAPAPSAPPTPKVVITELNARREGSKRKKE